jgi:hypothetical protein
MVSLGVIAGRSGFEVIDLAVPGLGDGWKLGTIKIGGG